MEQYEGETGGPVLMSMRDLLGCDTSDDEADNIIREPVVTGKKRKRRKDDVDEEEPEEENEDDDLLRLSKKSKSKTRSLKDDDDDEDGDDGDHGDRETRAQQEVDETSQNVTRARKGVSLRKRLRTARENLREAKQIMEETARSVFLRDVISGFCNLRSESGCERCRKDCYYWLKGEQCTVKGSRGNANGVIYTAFQQFYQDCEKMPDSSGVNWHNFAVSHTLRFSDVQYRPTFYLAADLVELLCADRSFVRHIRVPYRGRRLADFLMFAIMFHASENALLQIAHRITPEMTLLHIKLPEKPVAPWKVERRSKSGSIRKKRLIRYLKRTVKFILTTPTGLGTRQQRCILLTRLFLTGLRRPG